MAPPATPSPDALRPSNRTAASSRLFCPVFLLPLPFPYSCVAQAPSPASLSSLALSYWLGWFLCAPSPVQSAQFASAAPANRTSLDTHISDISPCGLACQ